MRILVADDQHTLARNIQRFLQMEELYTVDTVFDGEEALQKALHTEYDCIVLDVMMPGMNGMDVCASLREQNCTSPILMLTSLSDKKNTIRGLDVGADDYLTKPFDMKELSARLRALLRRTEADHSPLLQTESITVNPNTKEVHKDDAPIELAPKEYSLLEFLLRNKGKVRTREDIIEHVWGESEAAMFSQTLDVHIAYLRKKIGKKCIQTIPGSGYMIPEDAC